MVYPALARFAYSRYVDAQPYGSFQQLLREDAASREFVRLRRAIRKGNGDRERAIALICRCSTVQDLDALPAPLKNAALELLPQLSVISAIATALTGTNAEALAE